MIPAGGGRALIATGISIAIPVGFGGFVLPRSGLAAKHGISVVNAPGLIDAAYRGEIKVILLNTDPTADYEITRGDRIAQLVIQRVETVEWQVGRFARRRRSRRRLRPLRPLTSASFVTTEMRRSEDRTDLLSQTWNEGRTGMDGWWSAPGEDGLFEVGDALVDAAVEADPAELHQQRTGRRVDQIATERHLHDRAIALGDRDEPRRVVAGQLVEADAVDGEDLVGIRAATPPPGPPTRPPG